MLSIKHERTIRVFHRWIGLSALGFLFISVISGLLWANSKFLYWEDHYKEKVRPLLGPRFHSAKLSFDAALRTASSVFVKPAVPEQITLRSDFGRLVYDIRMRAEGSSKVLLIDADTGELLSPFTTEMAITVANQYVPEQSRVTAVTMERYTPRKTTHAVDAIRVSYDDKNGTQIILDRQSGEIIEDEGRWRRFHFFIMQLHQLNFLGFEKTLLNLPGLPLLLMGLSGLVLWVLHLARLTRARAAREAPALTGPLR